MRFLYPLRAIGLKLVMAAIVGYFGPFALAAGGQQWALTLMTASVGDYSYVGVLVALLVTGIGCVLIGGLGAASISVYCAACDQYLGRLDDRTGLCPRCGSNRYRTA